MIGLLLTDSFYK